MINEFPSFAIWEGANLFQSQVVTVSTGKRWNFKFPSFWQPPWTPCKMSNFGGRKEEGLLTSFKQVFFYRYFFANKSLKMLLMKSFLMQKTLKISKIALDLFSFQVGELQAFEVEVSTPLAHPIYTGWAGTSGKFCSMAFF